MTLSVTQGYRKWRDFIGHITLVICSNDVSMLHHFRDITIFLTYVTACDLEKFFNFDKTNEIIRHIRFSIYV